MAQLQWMEPGEVIMSRGARPIVNRNARQSGTPSRFEITSDEWDACVLLGGCLALWSFPVACVLAERDRLSHPLAALRSGHFPG